MTPQSIFLTILLALLAATAEATTLVQMRLEELTNAASVVARVRCLTNEGHWEDGEIWTVSTFEVVETLKGILPQKITVRLVGGKVGHLISNVGGVPRFQRGEEAILFLEPNQPGHFSVTSWAQGTFRIHRHPQTGRETVTQDTSGLAVFDPATRELQPGGTHKLPLEELKRRIFTAMERGPEPSRKPQ